MGEGEEVHSARRAPFRLTELRRQIHKLQEDLDLVSDTIANLTADQQGRPRAVTAADVEQILEIRRMRDSFFGENLFADPAWDILLNLFAARLGGRKITVSLVSEKAGVPFTTGVRWMDQLQRGGWLVRKPDESDRRLVLVEISDRGFSAMQEFFEGVGPSTRVV